MLKKENYLTHGTRHSLLLLASVALILSTMLVGCSPSTETLEAVDYTPQAGLDWKISTPIEQGLDPQLVAEAYYNAAELETLYGLLLIKNDLLIAEKYFNEGSIDQLSARHSATKSYTSALVGLAIEEGCLTSLDQKMTGFFPEYQSRVHNNDPRKEQITLRHLLQMRGGYPWDSTGHFGDILYLSGNWRWLPHMVDFPLVSDPGTDFNYSSVSSHLLGVALQRACDTDLESFAETHLFEPIESEFGLWTRDLDNYNWGWGELYVTARDMAKFGRLYLNGGEHEGTQVIPADWVHDSLQSYSEDAFENIGRFRHIGYGYQWWSARVGDHDVNFVWGHGGQLIVLLDELDIIVVTTASPLNELPPADGWKYEQAIIKMVGKFIYSLPSE